MMTIVYLVKNSLYINLTNRCPCACTFCLRQQAPGVYGSSSLWLDREPTRDEVVNALIANDYSRFDEIVFCGYGEPTERLDDLLAIATWIKARDKNTKIRVNTNGLSDLINNRSTACEFANLIDVISISLNTDDPNEYRELCKPTFGDKAYPALLAFARDAREFVKEVVLTIVGEPVTTKEKQSRCKKICDDLGVRLRIRPFE